MTIKVGFSKPKSKLAFFSYAIRLFQNSKFSHALISWNSQSINRDMIYQASHGMCHFISKDRFEEKKFYRV